MSRPDSRATSWTDRTDAALKAGLTRAHAAFDRWLDAPLPRAAGRQGLFRIVYALFFLWHLSHYHAPFLGSLPPEHRIDLFLLEPLPGWPTGAWLSLHETALAAALVVLLFGLGTRFATAAVFVLGLSLEAFFFAVDQEHATTMVAFYVPFFMLIAGGWGDTYSVDAFLRRRRGEPVADPSASAPRHVRPMRIILILLCGLIFTSGLFKMVGGGTWWSDPDVLGYLFVHKNVEATREGLWLNPLAPAIAASPSLSWGLQLATLALELSFPLALLGPRIRHVFIASILVFHAVNGLWMATTFTAFVVVYGLFVDWEWVRRRLVPRPPGFGLSAPLAIAGVLGLAALVGVLWNTPWSPRALLNGGGVLDWQTIWIPILPLALGWLGVAVVRLMRVGAARLAGERVA